MTGGKVKVSLSHLLLTLGLGNIAWAVVVLRQLCAAVLLGRVVLDGHQRLALAIAIA